MPRGDRTGPRGMGSRSGRGMGFCNGYGQPGFMSSGYGGGGGRGFGGGFGGGGFGGGRFGQGRGFWGGNMPFQAEPGFMPPAAYSKETEKGYLENEITYMKNHLSALEEQLKSVQDED
ncbi:MAG: DUF5320 domain-containing protein [Spirochaetaceae bacterium]|nr:DUF5320 domain-containing protein [Spirochaetaceae bacterium]